MRIISGKYKGRKLNPPGSFRARPTTDYARESLFNILSTRYDFEEKSVLDLFAGTGALGIEALSRGASLAAFVDCSRTALTVIKKNITVCRLDAKTAVFKRDILKNLAGVHPLHHGGFSLAFMDPPYNKNLVEPALLALENRGLLKNNACITIEHSRLEVIPENIAAYKISDQRKYGQTLVSFLTYRADK